MNQPWSDLPNAHHIDWVLASLKDNPDLWTAAWDAAWYAARDAAWEAAWDVAREAASDVAWKAVYGAARDTARDAAGTAARDAARAAASDAAWDAAWVAAWNAAGTAALALIAYDDCDQYLAMSYEELTIWAALSEHSAAFLLLPMVYVRENLHEPALV